MAPLGQLQARGPRHIRPVALGRSKRLFAVSSRLGHLARKLEAFRDYYNGYRVHRALAGCTPTHRAGASSPATAVLEHYAWQQHCRRLFQSPIAA